MEMPNTSPRYVSTPVLYQTAWEIWRPILDTVEGDRFEFLHAQAKRLDDEAQRRGVPVVDVTPEPGSPDGLAYTRAFPEPLIREVYGEWSGGADCLRTEALALS